MILGIIYAIIATVTNITVLSTLIGGGLPLQLSVVGAFLGWLYESPRFAWAVILTTGLLFDLLSSARFGFFTAFFVIAGLIIEPILTHPAHFGLRPTIFFMAALFSGLIQLIILLPAGFTWWHMTSSVIFAGLLTGGATVALYQFGKRFGR